MHELMSFVESRKYCDLYKFMQDFVHVSCKMNFVNTSL